MPVRIYELSRLGFSTLLAASNGTNDVEFWDLPSLPVVEPAADDIVYQVEKTDTIERLAYRFYGDPRLWDVIAQVNGMRILPLDLHPGDYIRIPSSTRVFTTLRRR